MPKDESKSRKRMVVEEVNAESGKTPNPPDTEPLEEIKEKVEELHAVTENIGESVEKSEEIQEEIVKATEKAVPDVRQVETPTEKPKTEFVPVKQSSGLNPLFILIPGV